MRNVVQFPRRQYSEKELLLIFARAFARHLKEAEGRK